MREGAGTSLLTPDLFRGERLVPAPSGDNRFSWDEETSPLLPEERGRGQVSHGVKRLGVRRGGGDKSPLR